MNATYIVSIPFGTFDKQYTHQGNLTKHAVKDLKTAYLNRDIDVAKHKSVELHVSGTKYFKKWVETALAEYFIRVHRAVPHCMSAILNFYKHTSAITQDYLLANDLVARNFVFYMNWIITRAEIPSSSSATEKLFTMLKMDKDDYNLTLLRKNNFLVSRNLNSITPFITSADPKEIVLPLSEISVLLSDPAIDKREFKLCYWMSWLLNYEKVYHKGRLEIPIRQEPGIVAIVGKANHTILTDWVIIIFHLIIHYTKTYSPAIKQTIQQLIDLYVAMYNGKKKKVEYMLYVAMIRWVLHPNGFPCIDAELLSDANAYAVTCNYSYSGITVIDP